MERRKDEKGYKIHHVWPSLRKNSFSRAIILIHIRHTTPAFAENKWRLVLYDFLETPDP